MREPYLVLRLHLQDEMSWVEVARIDVAAPLIATVAALLSVYVIIKFVVEAFKR